MKHVALPGLVAALAVGCSGSHARTLGGYGISISLPHGWYGVAAPGQLQAADFPLSRSVLSSAERAHVRRGHVHVIVWDYGPAVSYLARHNPPARPPLVFRRRDLSGPFEGFPFDHAFAIRSANLDGEIVEVLADLGPKPLAAARLWDANRIASSLVVRPARVLHAHEGVLARDGVSLRLPPGWSGRIEIPPSAYFVRFVLRARHGHTRLALLELAHPVGAKRVGLPLILVRRTKTFARSVVMAAGRTFDASAVSPSPAGLADAQRVLSRLRVRR